MPSLLGAGTQRPTQQGRSLSGFRDRSEPRPRRTLGLTARMLRRPTAAISPMQRFACEHCANEVQFETSTCPVCATRARLRAGTADAPDAGAGRGRRVLRDRRHESIVLALPRTRRGGATGSCPRPPEPRGAVRAALTRGRPDDGRPDAITRWSLAEAAKRRLVHQLDRLGLPVDAPVADDTRGLVFDLVYLPGERVSPATSTVSSPSISPKPTTGTVTSCGDDSTSHIAPSSATCVTRSGTTTGTASSSGAATWRVAVFGDERVDYAAALERRYATPDRAWDARRFISRYAASHPLEDWAESFAHYLHIVDVVETAAAYGLLTSVRSSPTTRRRRRRHLRPAVGSTGARRLSPSPPSPSRSAHRTRTR